MLNRNMMKTIMALAAVAGFGSAAHAALFTWGASGTGGAGTWNTTNSNWFDGATNTTWVSGSDAAFGGTAGTVTLGSSMTAGVLTFNTGGYVIAKGGYNLTAASLSGTGAVTFSGTGTASITGSSSGYSGTITLGPTTGASPTTDIVAIGASDSLGTGTVNMRGAQLQASAAGLTIANAINVAQGGFRVGGSNSFTLSGLVTMDGSSRSFVNYSSNSSTVTLSGGISTTTSSVIAFDTAGAPIVVSGSITGAGSISGSNVAYTATLSGSNSYSGGTTIAGGTFNINHAYALGTGTLTITGGTINNTSGSAVTLASNNAQAWNGDFTFTGSNPLNLGTGAVTLGAGRTVTISASTLTVGGGVSSGTSAYGITKAGSGTMILTGTSTYKGATVVNGGTLTIAAGAKIYSGYNAQFTGFLTVNTGGTVEFDNPAYGYSFGETYASSYISVNGGTMRYIGNADATWSNNAIQFGANGGTIESATVGKTLTISGMANYSQTSGSSVTLGGAGNGSFGHVLSGTGGLTKSGSGTWTLSNTGNTFSGSVTVNGGVLVGSGVSGGTNTTLGVASGSRTITVNNGGTLSFATANVFGGSSQTLANTPKVVVNSGGKMTTSNYNVVGNIDLNGGTLTATAGGSASYQTYEFNGSTITVGGSSASTISSSASSSGGMHIAGGKTLTLNVGDVVAGTDLTISAALINGSNDRSGIGALLKTGAGTVRLTAQNTYTGGTTISAGTLDLYQASSGTGVIRGTATVNAGGTLQLSGNDDLGYTAGSSNLSTLNLTGGTLYVNTTSNETVGSLVINMTGGTINGVSGGNIDFLGGSSAINSLASATTSTISGTKLSPLRQGSTVFTVAAGTTASGIDLDISSVIQTSPSGDAAGAVLTKAGAGTMRLSGANTIARNFVVRAGSIIASNNSAFGGSSNTVTLNDASTGASNASLLIDASAASITISNPITVANQGSGTTTIGVFNTAGTNQSIFSGAITLNKAVTLKNGGAGDRLQFSGGISGTGDVTIDGTNNTKKTVFITTANTFSGNVYITGNGMLQLSDGTSASASFIPDTSSVNLNTSGGYFNLAKGGNNETIGALNGVAGTVVQGVSGSDTLTIGNGGASGSYAGVIQGGSNLAITKTGAGVQTLSGSNSYTGATTVNGGTLNITGSLASGSAVTVAGSATLAGSGTVGGVTVNSGGVLTPGVSGSGTLTMSSLTLGAIAGDTATINIGTSGLPGSAIVSSALQVNGNVVANGGTNSATFAFGSNLANLASGTYPLINYTGAQLGDVTAFTYSGTKGAREGVTLVNGTKTVDLSITSAYPIWTGATSSDWSATTGNWKLNTDSTDTNFLANDTVHFDSSASSGTVNLTADVAPISVTVEGNTLNYTIGSTGGAKITSGLLAKTGTSTLTINNANTFGGGTTITGGTLVLGDGGALGSGAIALNGGTLDINGKTVANNVALGGGAISGNSGTLSGVVSNGVASTLTIGSNLTLTGTSTYTGATTINAGTLQIGNGTTDGSISSSSGITNNSALAYNLVGNQTYANVVGGTGTLTKSGAGTLTLTGVNSYGGATTISAGTLEIGGAGQLGSGSYAGDISNAGTFKVNSTANQTLSGAISGAGMLVKANTGTLTLSGANTYTSGTSITGGTLEVSSIADGSASGLGAGTGSAGFIGIKNATLRYTGTGSQTSARYLWVDQGTGTIDVANASATLTLNSNASATLNQNFTKIGAGALVLGGAISGTATVTVGAGTLTLTATNTTTGAMTITAGTLEVGGSGSLNSGSYAGNIADAGTLNINTSANQTLSGTISGTGALVKNNTGTLTISTVPTYTGNTTVSGGTLKINCGYGSTIATPLITVNSGATLDVASADTLHWTPGKAALTINGGTVTQSGTGYRQTIANTLNMTGGTLTSTGAGDANGNYSFLNGVGITATSDASGNAATVSANKITIQGGTTTLPLNVTRGAASPASDLTISSIIANYSGNTGSLAKSGNGILTLSGVNTYTGGTTVTAGTLIANNASGLGTGTLNVNGGTLTLGAAVAGVGAATLTTGTINGTGSLSASSFDVQSGTISAALVGAGALTKSTAGTVTLSATNTYTGGTTISAGRLTIGATDALRSGYGITMTGGELVGAGSGTYTITPSSITASSGTNRINANGTDVSLVITGTGGITSSGTTLYMSGSHTYSGMTTVSGTGYLEVSGAALNIANSVLNVTSTISGRAVDIWAGKLTVRGLTGSGIIVANGASGNAFSGTALEIATPGSESYTFSGTLNNASWSSGVMAIEKTGAGTQVLTGTNAFSGGMKITGGTISFNNGSLGSSGAITMNGGTLQWNGTNTQDISSRLTMVSGKTATFDTNGNNVAFASAIGSSTSAALVKAGSGTLTLSTANTYTGGTTINAGAIAVSASNTVLGAGTVAVNGGALDIIDGRTLANTVTGAGAINVSGTGEAKLSGNLSGFTGTINVNTTSGGKFDFIGPTAMPASSSTVNIASGATLYVDISTYAGTVNVQGTGNSEGFGALRLDNGAVISGTVNLLGAATVGSHAGTGTISGAIDGAYALTKVDGGTIILSGSNSYSGGTTINAGTLQIGTGGVTGSLGAGAVTNNGALVFNRSGSMTVGNDIGGTGSVEFKNGATYVLTGANSYGATTLDSGTLQIGNGGTSGTLGTGAVTNNGVIVYNRSDSYSLSGAISGTGSLQVACTGTLALTGSNSYSGGTAIYGDGVLSIVSGSLPSTGTVTFGENTVGTNGTLQWAANETVLNDMVVTDGCYAILDPNGQTGAVTGSISGNGILGLLATGGAGSVTLSGSNSYAGGTVVAAGTLKANNAHAFGTGAITVSGGTLDLNGNVITNSVTLSGGTLTNSAGYDIGVSSLALGHDGTVDANGKNLTITGMLSGSGTITAADVTLGDLAPGNSPGLVTIDGNATLVNGTYSWQMLDATGTAGVGYDSTVVTGLLDMSGLSKDGYLISVEALPGLANFDKTKDYHWTLFDYGTGTGFNATNFKVVPTSDTWWDTTNGQWSVSDVGGSIMLNYVVPEPGTLGLLALGALALLGRRRNRK